MEIQSLLAVAYRPRCIKGDWLSSGKYHFFEFTISSLRPVRLLLLPYYLPFTLVDPLPSSLS